MLGSELLRGAGGCGDEPASGGCRKSAAKATFATLGVLKVAFAALGAGGNAVWVSRKWL